MTEFLNSTVSMGTAILISVIVSMAYFACTILILFCIEYYDRHKKRKL